MIKRVSLLLCAVIWLSSAGSSMAAIAKMVDVKIDYAFTSDNLVNGFYLLDPWHNAVEIDLPEKSSDWRYAAYGSFTLSMMQDAQYTFQWDVQNLNGATPSYNDPMAFLGQFSVNGVDYYLSSNDRNIWAVNGETPVAYGALQSDNIWEDNGSNDPLRSDLLKFINPAAQWIGAGEYRADGGSSRMSVTASFVTPVPIPGAALLLGSALLGVVGIRRTRTV